MNAPNPNEDFASQDTQSFHEETSNSRHPEALQNRQIGPYRLVHRLGEGGMGSVWKAEQNEPVRREVAVKLIRGGNLDAMLLSRFEVERQALAVMNHENIAKVFDAGTTDDGMPYLVMELVDGAPVTKFCKRHKLTLHQRLKLFITICDAVQHAHQKGVAHRDLKPSNVLVSGDGDKPIVKVIDFGLAKATGKHDARLSDQTLTGIGQVVGTLQYMSPEQASFAGETDIDTRTDVYALGVMLYELITGSTPLSGQTLREQALLQVLKIIREQDPPRPSQRLSALGNELRVISRQRGMTPSKLQQVLRGDLDWIVMRSLEKDRDRRYSTADNLAKDVLRFLEGQTVHARPPSARYKLQKFVRRHRVVVGASATVTATLFLGIIATSWLWLRAETARKEAMVYGKRSADVLGVVRNSFSSVNPFQGGNFGMSAKDVLVNAQKHLDDSGLDEEGQRLLLSTLTTCFIGLGEYDAAADVGDKAVAASQSLLGPDHPETWQTQSDTATAYLWQERLEEAIPLFEDVLRKYRRRWGDDHADTLAAMNALGVAYHRNGRSDQAVEWLEKSLEGRRRILGDLAEQTINSMSNLAQCYSDLDRNREALAMLKDSLARSELALEKHHPLVLNQMSAMAILYRKMGRHSRALRIYDEVIGRRRDKLGPGHESTILAICNASEVDRSRGKYDDGLKRVREAWDLCETHLTPAHPMTLYVMHKLGQLHLDKSETDKAIHWLEQTLEIRRKVHGDKHPYTMESMDRLATAYQSDDRYADAIALFAANLQHRRAHLGATHVRTLDSINNLALAHKLSGNYDKAIALYESRLQLHERNENNEATLTTRHNLAVAFRLVGRLDEAISMHRSTLEDRQKMLGPEASSTLITMNCLASALDDAGQHREAIAMYEELLTRRQRISGPDNIQTLIVMNNLAATYANTGMEHKALELSQRAAEASKRTLGTSNSTVMTLHANWGASLLELGRLEEAESVLRDVVQWRQKTPSNWRTFDATGLLGETLRQRGDYDEAQRLLESAWKGLQEAGSSLPSPKRQRIRDIAEQLRQLSIAVDDAEAAQHWESIRDATDEGN